jgi:hypothetical protein
MRHWNWPIWQEKVTVQSLIVYAYSITKYYNFTRFGDTH